MPNYNVKTGIAYGVISAHSLDDEIVGDLLEHGENITLRVAFEDYLNTQTQEVVRANSELVQYLYSRFCEDFAHYIEEPQIEGTYEDVKYATCWLGGALNFFIFESPHVGNFTPCSPCVPGAANLDQPLKGGGIKGYDVPQDWRNQEF